MRRIIDEHHDTKKAVKDMKLSIAKYKVIHTKKKKIGSLAYTFETTGFATTQERDQRMIVDSSLKIPALSSWFLGLTRKE